MAKKGKGFFNEALLKQQRTRTRADLVGGDGVNIQDERRRKAKTPKAVGRDVQQRMKEYKQGYVERTIDKVKRYK
jgi:hypothetical protein